MGRGKKALLAGLMMAVAVGTYALLLHLDPLGRATAGPDFADAGSSPEPAPHPAPAPADAAPPEQADVPEPETEAALPPPPAPPAPKPSRPRAKIARRGNESAPARPPQQEPQPKLVMNIVDTTPPSLEILQPEDRSLTRRSPIPVRVQAEAGGRVLMQGSELEEKAGGLFSGRLTLKRGPNLIKIAALDAVGNRTERSLRVTFVDPQLERSQKRIGALLGKIEEIKALVAELDRQSAELVARIDSADDVDLINALSRELRQMRTNRKELEKAVEETMDNLDELSR